MTIEDKYKKARAELIKLGVQEQDMDDALQEVLLVHCAGRLRSVRATCIQVARKLSRSQQRASRECEIYHEIYRLAAA